MFNRKIYNKLLEWKAVSHGKTALLVEGARRVGKSTRVLAHGKVETRGLRFLSCKDGLKHTF